MATDTIVRRRAFSHDFNFLTAEGQPVPLTRSDFELIVEYGLFSRTYTRGSGLKVSPALGRVTLSLTPEQTAEYRTEQVNFRLYIYGKNGRERVADGVFLVQQ